MTPDKKIKILIIDNTHLLEDILVNILGKDSYKIKTEKTADLALLKIIHWNPKLIITSLEVGSINGFELCHIIRMMPDFAKTPIIIISSSKKIDRYHTAALVGADFYMKKSPKSLSKIKQRIHKILNISEKNPQDCICKKSINNILLVDDSSTMRKIIKNILSGIGITNIFEAEHGKDGIEQLKENDIDMIISDWNMPIMSGVEMVKKIRKKNKYNNIPIIMVTAEVKSEVEDQMSIGINDYIIKPFNVEDFQNLLSKYSECAK